MLAIGSVVLMGWIGFGFGFLYGRTRERDRANAEITRLLHDQRTGLFTALMGGFHNG